MDNELDRLLAWMGDDLWTMTPASLLLWSIASVVAWKKVTR